MPITLAKIANNAAKVTFRYGEDEVVIEYYPARITEKVFAQLQSFSSDESDVLDDFTKLNSMLCSLIKSWDVYEDEAQTTLFPLEPDRLAELPFAFRIALIKTIVGDMRPNQVATQTA